MNFYKIELYNYEHYFSIFITITAYGPQGAKENAEYLLEQMFKDPDQWMINSVMEEKNSKNLLTNKRFCDIIKPQKRKRGKQNDY
jgi:hypothetical protein